LEPSRGGAPAWFGAAGEPRSGLIAGEAPGPAVLGGPLQAKAPPAHSLMPCAWGGVEMSLLCPSGRPTGAHTLIYQANPIGRPARKATTDFSKVGRWDSSFPALPFQAGIGLAQRRPHRSSVLPAGGDNFSGPYRPFWVVLAVPTPSHAPR
jgi:hypothetical protein